MRLPLLTSVLFSAVWAMNSVAGVKANNTATTESDNDVYYAEIYDTGNKEVAKELEDSGLFYGVYTNKSNRPDKVIKIYKYGQANNAVDNDNNDQSRYRAYDTHSSRRYFKPYHSRYKKHRYFSRPKRLRTYHD